MTDLERTLRSLSTQDLLSLGLSQVAYIKLLDQDGHTYHAIHEANGEQLAVVASHEAAVAIIRQNDMDPVTVH